MAAEPAHFVALLLALTQPDTNTIRQAEHQLKPLLKNAANMIPLWQVVADPQQPEAVRHVGAIVLRKRLPTHYANGMEASLQLQWQQNVLNLLAQEQSRPVRAGLTGVAAALAEAEGKATPPFLQFLSSAANEVNNPVARELCFQLLQQMTETIGLHWKEHLQDLLGLFSSVLHSANEPTAVHKAAVQAVGGLMSFWADEPEIEALAPLLPVLLQVASRHWNDDEFLATVLDVLYDLAYSPAPALAQHMDVTLQFSLQCLQNRELEMRVRDSAALVIATTAEAKPKTLGRHVAMVGAILDTLFQMMQDSKESAAGALFESNPAWKADLVEEGHDFDDDDDPDAPTETSMAQGTLDMLACEVPKKYIWQPALTRCLERMQSGDANARKAGVAGLGVIAEGCAEPLTAALPQVLPAALQAARDPSAPVRECACFCLGQISEHCQPDILQYNADILPIVFGLLDDQSVAVQATSCYVLEMFCERLEPQAVRPLLDPLVRKLAAMLEATTKRSVQEMAVAALAATAVAAEEEFSPYVQGVAAIMTRLMSLQAEDQFSLRGRALECMGHMAIAVGRETFRPYFMETMQSAMNGLSLNSTDLQEFAYAVFANLAKVMKDDFAPALPELVPHLIEVIDMDEGQLEQASPSDDGGFAGLDDSDNEDEENGNYVLHVRTALLEVKKGAITALGEMAAHTGTSFCPFLETSMQVLQKAANNWHPIIKCEVTDAFPSLIVPSIAAYHNGEIQWKKGDVQSANNMSQHTAALVQAVLTEEIALLKDEDKATVGKACEAVQSVIELCGPHALTPVLNEVLSCTFDLLTRNAPCQTADDIYGEAPDDDDDPDQFMSATCDLVGAMGRVLGNHFGQFLPQFLPAICEYTKSSRPPSERSMAVGCLSELVQELDTALLEHWKSVFFPVILAGLADEDDNVKRNACFCAGMACENLKDSIAADFPALLQALGPIFSMDTSSGLDATLACVDNSAAAVARMIMAAPHLVPLDQVLPVFLRALPLKADTTENATVYKCLMGIMPMPDYAAFKPEFGRIIQEALQQEKLEDEIKGQLRQAAGVASP
jgi:hypothetical protein